MWAAICWVSTAIAAAKTEDASCNVSVGFNTYKEEILISNITNPFGLAVDYTTNIMYFNYIINGTWLSAEMNLYTKAVKNIEELIGQCTFAVDQMLEQVHASCGSFGEGTGLHQYDSNVGQFDVTGEETRRVQFVHFNEVLYYSVHPSYSLYTFRLGHSTPVENLTSRVYGLVIDKHKDRIFYNFTGIYHQQHETAEISRYEEISDPQAVAVDKTGVAYACSWGGNAGVYRLHERPTSATRLLNVDWCTSLTFDRDNNVIYSNFYTGIYRLLQC